MFLNLNLSKTSFIKQLSTKIILESTNYLMRGASEITYTERRAEKPKTNDFPKPKYDFSSTNFRSLVPSQTQSQGKERRSYMMQNCSDAMLLELLSTYPDWLRIKRL
jgi:hypothetical protein